MGYQVVVDRPLVVSPQVRYGLLPRATVPTHAYRFSRSLLVVLVVVVLDIHHFFVLGGSLRYLLLALPMGAIVLMRFRVRSTLIRRAALPDRVLFVLWVFGLVGTLYGILALHSDTTLRPVFLPMTIAFLYLFVLDCPSHTEVVRLVRSIAWIGSAYIVVVAVVNAGLVPASPRYTQFLNAESPLVAIGLAGAIILHRPFRLAALVTLAALNFIAYPSATSVLAIFALVISFYVTRPRPSPTRPYLVGAVITLGVFLGILNLARVATLASQYLGLVGKSNSVNLRLTLWEAGINQFERSPFIGEAFSTGSLGGSFGGPSLPVPSRILVGGSHFFQLPYHNDYVLFLAEGGLVGFGLLATWIVTVESTLLRRYRAFQQAGQPYHAALLRIVLITLNVFFTVMIANPVLGQVSMCAVMFSLYGLAMVLGLPERSGQASSARRDQALVRGLT